MFGIGPDGPLGPPMTAPALPADQCRVGVTTNDRRRHAHGDWATRTEPGAAPQGVEVGSEPAAWAVLTAVGGLGPIGFGALLRRFGSASGVLAAAGSTAGRAAIAALDLEEEHGRLRLAELAPRIADAADSAAAYIARVRDLGLSVVTLEDPGYPSRLRTIDLPPHVLFVRGDIAALSRPDAVAVVGTRRPSDGGRRTAARISAALARLGATVVSGLAVGIDGAAHAATLDADGCTVAVLAGGHARLYPRVHDRLADRIVANGGAVVAELPPDTAPGRGTFPRRNRLISGLADATIVVEAGKRSGALITAGWALEQGRECFVVPGAIDAPTSAGCLAFLRTFSGVARIVSGIAELVEDLGIVDRPVADAPSNADAGSGSSARGTFPAPGGSAPPRNAGPPSGEGTRRGDSANPNERVLVPARSVLAEAGEVERAIGLRLVAGPCTVDELVAAEDLPVATVLGGLTLLEMRGFVQGSYGRYMAAGPLLAALPDGDAAAGRPRDRGRRRRPATGVRHPPAS